MFARRMIILTCLLLSLSTAVFAQSADPMPSNHVGQLPIPLVFSGDHWFLGGLNQLVVGQDTTVLTRDLLPWATIGRLAKDGQGNVYAWDNAGYHFRQWSPDGVLSAERLGEDKNISLIANLVYDAEQNRLLFSSEWSQSLYRFNLATAEYDSEVALGDKIVGIAPGTGGKIYTLSSNGTLSLIEGDAVTKSVAMNAPTSLHWYQGYLFVLEGNRIAKFDGTLTLQDEVMLADPAHSFAPFDADNFAVATGDAVWLIAVDSLADNPLFAGTSLVKTFATDGQNAIVAYTNNSVVVWDAVAMSSTPFESKGLVRSVALHDGSGFVVTAEGLFVDGDLLPALPTGGISMWFHDGTDGLLGAGGVTGDVLGYRHMNGTQAAWGTPQVAALLDGQYLTKGVFANGHTHVIGTTRTGNAPSHWVLQDDELVGIAPLAFDAYFVGGGKKKAWLINSNTASRLDNGAVAETLTIGAPIKSFCEVDDVVYLATSASVLVYEGGLLTHTHQFAPKFIMGMVCGQSGVFVSSTNFVNGQELAFLVQDSMETLGAGYSGKLVGSERDAVLFFDAPLGTHTEVVRTPFTETVWQTPVLPTPEPLSAVAFNDTWGFVYQDQVEFWRKGELIKEVDTPCLASDGIANSEIFFTHCPFEILVFSIPFDFVSPPVASPYTVALPLILMESSND
jgi:hypothetical protein